MAALAVDVRGSEYFSPIAVNDDFRELSNDEIELVEGGPGAAIVVAVVVVVVVCLAIGYMGEHNRDNEKKE